MTPMIAAAPSGVRKPHPTPPPPPTPPGPAAGACRWPGRRPSPSKNCPVPAMPCPPKEPKSFWAPWAAKSPPTTMRRTNSARSMPRRYPTGNLSNGSGELNVIGLRSAPEGSREAEAPQGRFRHALDARGVGRLPARVGVVRKSADLDGVRRGAVARQADQVQVQRLPEPVEARREDRLAAPPGGWGPPPG